MKPFLILQLRPETEAADNEYEAFLEKGGLQASETHRIRLDCEDLPADLDLNAYSGVIVGGGPGCVSDAAESKSPVERRIEDAVMGLMPEIAGQDLPFLGCCYGIGILAHYLGAEVSKARYGEEVGPVDCALGPDAPDDPLLEGFPRDFTALVGHKEAVQELPEGCAHLVRSGPCPFQMVRYRSNVYATQFHPEADADVFAVRVEIYKDRGYFDPAAAARIIDSCNAAQVDWPQRILRNFTATYRSV